MSDLDTSFLPVLSPADVQQAAQASPPTHPRCMHFTLSVVNVVNSASLCTSGPSVLRGTTETAAGIV